MFIYKGSYSKIMMAIEMANSPSLFRSVLSKIASANNYDMSNCGPDEISHLYGKFMEVNNIEVLTYFNRFTRAMGFFSPQNPKAININMAKYWGVEQMVSLFYHESGHVWDMFCSDYNVNHGSNSPIGKDNTFQYSLNRYVYEYLDYKREPRKSFTRRLLNKIRSWF